MGHNRFQLYRIKLHFIPLDEHLEITDVVKYKRLFIDNIFKIMSGPGIQRIFACCKLYKFPDLSNKNQSTSD